MNVRKEEKLRGPVRTCSVQRSWFSRRCGGDACEVEENGDRTELEFHEDGTLLLQSHTNPDRSRWTIRYEREYEAGQLRAVLQMGEDGAISCRTEYDEQGRVSRVIEQPDGTKRITEKYEYEGARKKRTQYVGSSNRIQNTLYSYRVQGTETGYSAPGTTKVSTLYDEREQPVELLFHDASERLLSRVAFTYDADGNLIEELQTRPWEGLGDVLNEVPRDQLEAVQAMLTSIGQPIRVTHRYDSVGHRVETHMQFGLLSDETKRMSYNENGDEITQVSETHSRGCGPDEQGKLAPVPDTERVSGSEARFLYEYDAYGNWTMKTVEGRGGIDSEFSVSSIERRTIQYFEQPD